jgi:hypothetical protein
LLLLFVTAFILVLPQQILSQENNNTQNLTSILYLLLTPTDSTPVSPYPAVAGTYSINNEMVIPTMPARMQPVLDELFTDPGGALLRILALTASGVDYWKDSSSWDMLFDECVGVGDPSAKCTAQGDVVTTPFGVIVAEHILVVANEGMQALGLTSETFETALERGPDILDNVESFALGGNLVIAQDPDADGLLGTSSTMVLNSLTWRWGGNEGILNLREEAYIRASNIAGAVVFHPSDGTTPSLQLEPFELSLNYPEILLWVVEGVIFPTIIDNSIQSFEDLFFNMLDCESLRDRIECTGAYLGDPGCNDLMSFMATEAQAACDSVQSSASTQLEYLLTTMQTESTYAVMQTPTNDPCRIQVESSGDIPTATGLGESTVMCPWSAELRYSLSGEETLIGEWWGTRL